MTTRLALVCAVGVLWSTNSQRSASLSGGRHDQQPAFSTKVEAVRVDVLVLDGGRPVIGLGPADFDGPHQVDFVSYEQVPRTVVLALDMSESVAGERLAQLRDAGQAVLDGLARDDQSALVTFSNVVSLGAPLTKDAGAARAALAD